MSDMLAYSLAMLSGVTEALSSEPLIYLFGFILMAVVFKIFLFFRPRL